VKSSPPLRNDNQNPRQSPNAPPNTALATSAPGAEHHWDSVEMQRLWLATQKRPWRSLAVIAGSPGVDTLAVADMLARIAWWYRGQPTGVVDLRDLRLRLVEHQLEEIAELTTHGERLILALRSVSENPTVVPVAKITDAAVMCVELGTTSIRSARSAVDEIGKDRFLGSIVLKPSAAAHKNAAAQKNALQNSPPPGNTAPRGPIDGKPSR
jgi:hypothetical protein